MRNRNNTCCFTGHRDISAVTYHDLNERLEPIMMRLIQRGYKYFVCGGALGFDTYAAMYVCALKKRGFEVKLVLVLPCRDQTAKWSDYDRSFYQSLLGYADEIHYTAEKYYPGCMQKRNRALVDASSACICYLTSSRSSGTKQTVEYARSKGLPIINIAN